MIAFLGIGAIVCLIVFLLLHKSIDKDLRNRFIYAIVGIAVISSAALATKISKDFSYLYVAYQLFFVFIGIIHLIMLYKYDLLKEEFTGSLSLTTSLTLLIAVAGALGFALLSNKLLKTTGAPCSASVLPFLLPFFGFVAYDLWNNLPKSETTRIDLDSSGRVAGPTTSPDVVSFIFIVPKRYTGLKGKKGEVHTDDFSPASSLKHAFQETIKGMLSTVDIDERHRKILIESEWKFYRKTGFFGKEELSPPKSLHDIDVRQGSVVYIKRV